MPGANTYISISPFANPFCSFFATDGLVGTSCDSSRRRLDTSSTSTFQFTLIPIGSLYAILNNATNTYLCCAAVSGSVCTMTVTNASDTTCQFLAQQSKQPNYMMQISTSSSPKLFLSTFGSGLAALPYDEGSSSVSLFTLTRTTAIPSPLYLNIGSVKNNGSSIIKSIDTTDTFNIKVNGVSIFILSEGSILNQTLPIDWHFFCKVGSSFVLEITFNSTAYKTASIT